MNPACPTCHRELIRRNRLLLLVTGMAFLAGAVAVLPYRALWLPAAIAGGTGGYLILWGSAGKGLWCRHCKKFVIGKAKAP